MIGIDEVGRGAWAGPLLVVAYRQRQTLPSHLTDSKLLTARKRLLLIEDIIRAGDIGEGWVSAQEIDEHRLSFAMRLGVSRALEAITAHSHETIVMDGTVNYCPLDYVSVTTVIKADQTYPAVSAASVYAKVLRDQYMQKLAEQFPQYGFEKHVGYGTALHRQCLSEYGPTNMHRKSYKPVRVQHELHRARQTS